MPYLRNQHQHQHQQSHSRRANGSSKRRSQHQLHDHRHHHHHQQQPVEFPPLSDDSDYDLMHHSASSTAATTGAFAAMLPPPATQQQQQQQSQHYGAVPGSGMLQSASPDEYYHPASFPGYTVVQIANGGEGQALLPRITHHRRGDGSHQQQQQQQQQQSHRNAGRMQIRRAGIRRGRSCCARFCGWICSCLCFLLGAIIVSLFIAAVLFVSRSAFPPSWELQCSESHLELHTDKQFVFPADKPLRIQSIQGISVSEVHVLKAAAASPGNVTVHAVVEINRGGLKNVVSVDRQDQALVIRAIRPRWEWPRDCVRAKLFITLPAYAAEKAADILPALYVDSGLGRLNIMDVGELGLGDLHIAMHNGVVQMRELGIQGSLHVSTTNGRINATRLVVPVGSAVFTSTNAALSLQNIQALGIGASTTNGAISAQDLHAGREISLQTSNSAVIVHGVHARETVDISTSNGPIRGDVASTNGPVALLTTNAAVGIRVSGVSGSHAKDISVVTSNAAADVDFAGVYGAFDVRTTNGRANVRGSPSELIKLGSQTNARKTGTFGVSGAGQISVASTNSPVNVSFAAQ